MSKKKIYDKIFLAKIFFDNFFLVKNNFLNKKSLFQNVPNGPKKISNISNFDIFFGRKNFKKCGTDKI